MQSNPLRTALAACAMSFVLLHTPQIHATSFITLKKMATGNVPASSLYKQSMQPAPFIVAPKLNITSLAKEDKTRESSALPYRFAIPLASSTNFTKNGGWETRGDTAIWRMKVTSKNAQSFNFGLKNVFFPKGTKLFFYDENYSIVLGPYTEKDNKSHGELWTPVIESDNVTIEINVPVKMRSYLKFEIVQINQGYRGIKSTQIAKSGSCNIDVVCPEGDAWRDEIRSVARYSIDGSFLCTGSIINNARGDFKPYFLSAGHCGVDNTNDASLVFYWNYETTICQGNPNGQLNQFSNGSTFRAASSSSNDVIDSDFVITELDDLPDSAFDVYWAGWDNSGPAPSSAVGIHHPAGDEKRISIENDPLTITSYGGNTENADSTHLRIGSWDSGTTEGGSSGSGIWNSAHHLVGTLSGGSASCIDPTESDWYGRFSVHWEGNGSADGQVKAWLDPDNTGITTVDGINICDTPTVTITSSPATAQIGQQIEFSATTSGGAGTYTYTWDFNSDGIIDSTVSNPAFTYNYFYQGNIVVTAYDATNCPGTDSAAIVVDNGGVELFPVTAEVPVDWSVPAQADASWILEDGNTVFEGTYSIKSETITDSQTASIEVTQNFTGSDNFISFAYKVSSEDGYDYLKFYIDGIEKNAWSGEIPWSMTHYQLTADIHTLRWEYAKDDTLLAGSDRAWIDAVSGLKFSTSNEAPVATIAATTINTSGGENVYMDASQSSDPDGDTLSFNWEQTNSPLVLLTNSNASIATFIAPDVTSATELTFTVTVTDTAGNSDTVNVSVTVTDVPANQPPVATVTESNITAVETESVTLDASQSSDPDGDTLSFNWEQTNSPAVSLTDSNAAVVTFIAPDVTAATELTFTVTVTDTAGNSDTVNVSVTVTDVPANQPPVATVTESNITAVETESVTLDASQSSDPDGDTLSFNWEQTNSPAVSLTDSNAAVVTFIAPDVTAATELTFTVTVTDTVGNSDTVNVSVTVDNSNGGGGGSFGIMFLAILLLVKSARLRYIL